MRLLDTELTKEQQAENALYALQLLSKVDDRLDLISKIAARAIKGDFHAKEQLAAWKMHCSSPLKINFSIKPYYLKNSLHGPYRLFTKQEMEFWKITMVFIGADSMPQFLNLQEIGEKENFTCTQLLDQYPWLRDYGILHLDGRFSTSMLINTNEYDRYNNFNDGSSKLRSASLGYLSEDLRKCWIQVFNAPISFLNSFIGVVQPKTFLGLLFNRC